MNLTEFFELNKSGTRAFDANGSELHINQYTDTDKYTVVLFMAVCDDLVFVWVK